MALNDFQKEEAKRLFSEGKTVSDVYRHLGAKSAGFRSPLDFSPTSILNQPSRIESAGQELGRYATGVGRAVADLPSDVADLGRGVQNQVSKFGGNVTDAVTRDGLSLPQRGAGLVSSAVSFGTGLVGEAVVGAGRFAATPGVERAVSDRVASGVEKAMESDTAKSVSDWYNAQDEQTKYNVSRLMLPALDLVSTAAPVGLFGKLFNRSTKAAETGVSVESKLQDAFVRAEQGDVSDATRIANATLDDATRTAEVDKLAKAYQDSLVGDRMKVNRLLQEQANDMTRGDVSVTQDDLIKALANEGIIPDIRGKLADFTEEIRNLNRRQSELFDAYEPILEKSRAAASLDDFAAYAKQSMANSRNLRFELDKANANLDRVLANLRQAYGLDENGRLTAKQIDEISREANARSKAYRDGGNTFEADVYSELGRAARSWLNDNIPDNAFREVNDEWLRLENVKRTAEAMQNQQIDVGLLGRALGSYVTTLTGVTLGANVANPFAGVAAGILVKMGGDQIADMMRLGRFSPEIRTKLQERLTNDKALIEKLKQTATTQENKNLFDDISRMLPAPKPGAARSEVSSGAPIRTTATGASAPVGNVIEDAVGGSIKVPGGEGAPLRRGLFPSLGEAELQKLKTDSFRKLLNDVGVDPDEVAKAIAGGTLGTLLMLYMNEDGTMLPAFGAILSVGVSRASKLTMLDEALRANNMRREALLKGGMSENSSQIKALEKQNTALAKEKAKVEDSLSPGLGIKDVSGKAKGANPQTTALLEEAKNASELAGQKVFRATASDFDPSKIKKSGKGVGFYVTSDEEFAKGFLNDADTRAAKETRFMEEFTISPNAKILSRTDIPKKYLWDYEGGELSGLEALRAFGGPQGLQDEVAKWAIKNGYDVVDYSSTPGKNIIILSEKAFE